MTEEQNKLLANIIYHIKRSMALPKWSVKLFWALSVIILLVLGYALFQVSRIAKKEQAAFTEGESNAVRRYELFMEENPEVSALYEEWRNAKGKSSLRPMEFLLLAYLPEHGRNPTGSTRKVWGKIWV